MDRLTKPGYKFNLVNVLEGLSHYADIDEILNRLSAYEDTGLEPEDLKKAFNEQAIINLAAQALGTTADRLRELAEADKDGRVAVLPCKPGEYWTRDKKRYYITAIFITKNSGVMVEYIADGDGLTFVSDSIYFENHFTREETEQALKEREQK